jgi:SAM-dependent methyltransferase
MTGHTGRFDGIADRYAAARPSYPASFVRRLADAIRAEPPLGGDVLDVGSGTGIFTRQLRALLPAEIAMTGIEPSADMRAAAAAADDGSRYLDGTAEQLPMAAGSARAVVAATAAHWFDRSRFYGEAARVLRPQGMLAIVEYVRDEKGSPAAAAVVAFLARHGGPRSYERPDYMAEMAALDGFGPPTHQLERMELRLTPEAYVGLALSSSHAKAAIRDLGQKESEAALHGIAASLVRDGTISFGYIVQAFVSRRS